MGLYVEFTIMKCPENPELEAYLDGALDDRANRDLLAHLDSCPACSARAVEMSQSRPVKKLFPEPVEPGTDCVETETLGLFVEGLLDKDEEQNFLKHMRLCRECRSEALAFARGKKASLDGLASPSADALNRIKHAFSLRNGRTAKVAKSTSTVFRWAIPIASAAVIAIIAVIYVNLYLDAERQGQNSRTNGIDKGRQPRETNPESANPTASNAGPRENVAEPGSAPQPAQPGPADVEVPEPKPAPVEPKPDTVPSEQPEPAEQPGEVETPEPDPQPATPSKSKPVEELPWETVKLKTVPLKANDEIHLSGGSIQLNRVLLAGSRLALAPGIETKVYVKTAPDQLLVDTDGDGKYEVAVGRNGGMCWLKLKTEAGASYNYALAFAKEGKDWGVKSASYLAGRVDGVPVTIADENANGSYSDVGVDSISVGNSGLRAFLGQVISADGQLVEFGVDTGGEAARFRPYTGPLGVIDMQSGFSGKARISSVIVCSETCSFNLAAMRKGSPVPSGNYRLVHARLSAFTKRMDIDVMGCVARTIDLEEGGLCVYEWGGPVHVDFDFSLSETAISIRKDQIMLFGRGGEAYFIREESIPPPKIQVRDPATGKILSWTTLGTGVTSNGKSSVPGTAGAG